MNVFSRLKYIALADFGIQMALAIPAMIFKTEKFFDLSGATTTVLLTWATLYNSGVKPSQRQIINSLMISTWGIRLSTFLFFRILKDGKDRRFNKARSNPATMMLFWSVQAIWILMDGLPGFILNSREDDTPTTSIDWVGRFMFLFGFAIQAIADHQKTAFRADPSNRSKFITSGLWKLSQHPNYFGEMLIWTGIWLSSVSALKGAEHIAALTPIFTIYLLCKVSGIPLLQKHAKKKWGHLKEFKQYQETTPLLVPSIKKILGATKN